MQEAYYKMANNRDGKGDNFLIGKFINYLNKSRAGISTLYNHIAFNDDNSKSFLGGWEVKGVNSESNISFKVDCK